MNEKLKRILKKEDVAIASSGSQKIIMDLFGTNGICVGEYVDIGDNELKRHKLVEKVIFE